MEKEYNPRCRGGFARWGQGNYTLIRDDDQEQAEYALDLRMCFNVMSGEEEVEAGGQAVYIARGEDEELVTVTPEENTLSLVYRYVDTGKQGNRGNSDVLVRCIGDVVRFDNNNSYKFRSM